MNFFTADLFQNQPSDREPLHQTDLESADVNAIIVNQPPIDQAPHSTLNCHLPFQVPI
jgi:hypothetical protein